MINKKSIENKYILNDEEYDIYVNHWMTIEEYIYQAQEARNKEITKRRDR